MVECFCKTLGVVIHAVIVAKENTADIEILECIDCLLRLGTQDIVFAALEP